MQLLELKRLSKRHEALDIHVVNHPHSQYYTVEIRHDGDTSPLAGQAGKPMVFRSIDAVYSTLAQAGIKHAYLVRQPSKVELLEGQLSCGQAELLRTPLSF